MLFGRSRKTERESEDVLGPREIEIQDQDTEGRAESGPFDVSEVGDREGYVDLGAVLISPRPGLELRLEVEETSQRVVAVTLDLGDSSVQVQAFAAPRSEGLWDEIREQIAESVRSQGGQADQMDGSLGTELIASVPAEAPDGGRGYRVARFVGVDGPRWFLRGVFSGPAAIQQDAATELEELFRALVVVRGESPMPPRELLPLTMPTMPQETAGEPGDPQQGLQAPERGPEITEIG
ncbi:MULTISPECIES: DUF3710 domain-containing protein [Arthrobacter]|uniref:DUF3710 domain-containing protein n=2 Tax=Arthrobacter TaxID=1663 RepID=A0ABU9KIV9_9MICC|nr:DUF3710 domain-containing protein [Arthrobacter sp. YJM1]MDP5225854.1 DUF3710 domain-containing protein [Arthrobacter sp. YJM1]